MTLRVGDWSRRGGHKRRAGKEEEARDLQWVFHRKVEVTPDFGKSRGGEED